MTHWKSDRCLSKVSVQGQWSGISPPFLHRNVRVLDKQPKPGEETIIYKEIKIKRSSLQSYLDYIALLFVLWKIILSEGECVELLQAVIRKCTDKNVLRNCMCRRCGEPTHIMLTYLFTEVRNGGCFLERSVYFLY